MVVSPSAWLGLRSGLGLEFALGEMAAQCLQPLGYRRCEAPLAAARRHEEPVLRAVDLVGAMRAAALLDGLLRQQASK